MLWQHSTVKFLKSLRKIAFHIGIGQTLLLLTAALRPDLIADLNVYLSRQEYELCHIHPHWLEQASCTGTYLRACLALIPLTGLLHGSCQDDIAVGMVHSCTGMVHAEGFSCWPLIFNGPPAASHPEVCKYHQSTGKAHIKVLENLKVGQGACQMGPAYQIKDTLRSVAPPACSQKQFNAAKPHVVEPETWPKNPRGGLCTCTQRSSNGPSSAPAGYAPPFLLLNDTRTRLLAHHHFKV